MGSLRNLILALRRSAVFLQAHLPTSKVVKAFNNIYFKHLLSLSRPRGQSDRLALPIAGDDAAAKAVLTAFLTRLVMTWSMRAALRTAGGSSATCRLTA